MANAREGLSGAQFSLARENPNRREEGCDRVDELPGGKQRNLFFEKAEEIRSLKAFWRTKADTVNVGVGSKAEKRRLGLGFPPPPPQRTGRCFSYRYSLRLGYSAGVCGRIIIIIMINHKR